MEKKVKSNTNSSCLLILFVTPCAPSTHPLLTSLRANRFWVFIAPLPAPIPQMIIFNAINRPDEGIQCKVYCACLLPDRFGNCRIHQVHHSFCSLPFWNPLFFVLWAVGVSHTRESEDMIAKALDEPHPLPWQDPSPD